MCHLVDIQVRISMLSVDQVLSKIMSDRIGRDISHFPCDHRQPRCVIAFINVSSSILKMNVVDFVSSTPIGRLFQSLASLMKRNLLLFSRLHLFMSSSSPFVLGLNSCPLIMVLFIPEALGPSIDANRDQ